VPLPTLQDSCERFLQWCAPLLTAEELAETEAATTAFRAPTGPGPRLQAALERYDAVDGVHSWLDDFWRDRYLGRRDPIALNANYFFLLKDSERAQVGRAAELVAAAIAYKAKLDAGAVPPVCRNGRPMSMEQNKYLFGATRIPGAIRDTVRLSCDELASSQPRHIVVFRRGHLFRMEVLTSEGRPYSIGDLEAGFNSVLSAVKTSAPPQECVGHLTTAARAAWATSRAALLAVDSVNAAVLDEIETALLCVCLEDVAPADTLDACDRLLHGDGASRWFDKSLSFIVFEGGRAGVNIEHCGLDGTTVLDFLDSLADARESSQAGVCASPFVRPLEFALDEPLRAVIRAAANSFARMKAEVVSTVLSFDHFGADHIKKLKMSPDAFVQMAFQLTHQRVRGQIGATYESIATRQYRHGRTEAMRVVTPESIRFVAAMDDSTADAATRREAFRRAADAHVERARQCQTGEAPEQHLWALQFVARKRGAELGVGDDPEFFASPGWLKMRDDYLSTSSAPSPNIEHFGFGSTSEVCIGIAYALLADRVNVHLNAPRPVSPEMSAFAEQLTDVLGELDGLLADGGG
jgi:carnitine O-acetyltransferase